jgi:CheY-like chemotaxis protein/DNA-binding XRE family transcriptional regulator
VAKGPQVSRSDSDLQNRLGAVIRRCRHRLGISQEELAWRADIHRTYLADVERGARNITLRTVSNLAKALQISIGSLFAHINAPSRTALHTRAKPAPSKMREILLVVEDAADAAVMARAFKRAGLVCPLRIVRDGETGLDYLFGTGRYARRKPMRPHLILLNLNLPKMTGSEFIRLIRHDVRTRGIPVVLLTLLR